MNSEDKIIALTVGVYDSDDELIRRINVTKKQLLELGINPNNIGDYWKGTFQGIQADGARVIANNDRSAVFEDCPCQWFNLT